METSAAPRERSSVAGESEKASQHSETSPLSQQPWSRACAAAAVLSACFSALFLAAVFGFVGHPRSEDWGGEAEVAAEAERRKCRLSLSPSSAVALSVVGSAAYVGFVWLPHVAAFVCWECSLLLRGLRLKTGAAAAADDASLPTCCSNSTAQETGTLFCANCGRWSGSLLRLGILRSLLEADAARGRVVLQRAASLACFCGACAFLLWLELKRRASSVAGVGESSLVAESFPPPLLRCLCLTHPLDEDASVSAASRKVLRVCLLLYGPSICIKVAEKSAQVVLTKRVDGAFGGGFGALLFSSSIERTLLLLRRVFFAPVFEEFFFRAVLSVLALSTPLSDSAAALGGAALFSVAHAHPALVHAAALAAVSAQRRKGSLSEEKTASLRCLELREHFAASQVSRLLSQKGLLAQSPPAEQEARASLRLQLKSVRALLLPYALQVAQTFVFGVVAEKMLRRFWRARRGSSQDGGFAGAFLLHAVCNWGGLPTLSFLRSGSPLYRQRKLLLLLQVCAVAAAAKEIF